MDGFGSHTFQWVNASGEVFWVKHHSKLTKASRISSPKRRDASRAPTLTIISATCCERSTAPYASWTLKIQIMPAAEAAKYRLNPFDVTNIWSHRDYPRVTVGRIVLNRDPENCFAEVEQAAFNSAHFVPAIGPSPDRMLQGRLFSYVDTHRYRRGAPPPIWYIERSRADRPSSGCPP